MVEYSLVWNIIIVWHVIAWYSKVWYSIVWYSIYCKLRSDSKAHDVEDPCAYVVFWAAVTC